MFLDRLIFFHCGMSPKFERSFDIFSDTRLLCPHTIEAHSTPRSSFTVHASYDVICNIYIYRYIYYLYTRIAIIRRLRAFTCISIIVIYKYVSLITTICTLYTVTYICARVRVCACVRAHVSCIVFGVLYVKRFQIHITII